MLVITNQQMEAFRQTQVEKSMAKFVQKSVTFLQQNFSDWCVEKELSEIEAFVQTMIEFGEKYKIRKKRNLQKLMFLKIEYKFDIPLSESLNNILLPVDIDETYRLTQFYKILDKSSAKKTKHLSKQQSEESDNNMNFDW